jgi:hypothetical protein
MKFCISWLNPGFDREEHLYIKVVAFPWCALSFMATIFAPAQQPNQIEQSRPPDAKGISVRDVCAAALPRATEGKQFQWSPDGRSVAYFKAAADGYGLRMELDAVDADGGDRRVLLTSQAIDRFRTGSGWPSRD